jgi:hypothetical protein
LRIEAPILLEAEDISILGIWRIDFGFFSFWSSSESDLSLGALITSSKDLLYVGFVPITPEEFLLFC